MNRRALTQLTSGLAEQGFVVIEGLFSERVLTGLSEQLLSLDEREVLTPARVGRGADRQRLSTVRGDTIHWLPPAPSGSATHSLRSPLELLGEGDERALTASELLFYQEVSALVEHLNRSFFMGIRRYEFHYARYESGAGYERHSDRFKGSDERVISLVTYLNRTWRPGDGGELKVYLPDDVEGGESEPNSQERHLIVSPLWGYTVCFESARFEHEVLPAYTPRQSVTGWLRR